MKHAWIAVAAAVLLVAAWVFYSVPRAPSRPKPVRRAETPKEIASAPPEIADGAPSKRDEPPVVPTLPIHRDDPVLQEAERLMDQIDWKFLGKWWLDTQSMKADASTPETWAELIRTSTQVQKLKSLLAQRPELKKEFQLRTLEGHLRAMDVELTDAQRVLLADFAARDAGREEREEAAIPEDQDPLEGTVLILTGSHHFAQTMQGILRPDQMEAIQRHQPTDGLWPIYRKTITARDPSETIQKISEYWTTRFALADRHRAEVRRIAEEYYVSYRGIHSDFAQADASRRLEIWTQTAARQKEAQQKLRELNPDRKADISSIDSYQILVLER